MCKAEKGSNCVLLWYFLIEPRDGVEAMNLCMNIAIVFCFVTFLINFWYICGTFSWLLSPSWALLIRQIIEPRDGVEAMDLCMNMAEKGSLYKKS